VGSAQADAGDAERGGDDAQRQERCEGHCLFFAAAPATLRNPQVVSFDFFFCYSDVSFRISF
jgi:hypothetical protein